MQDDAFGERKRKDTVLRKQRLYVLAENFGDEAEVLTGIVFTKKYEVRLQLKTVWTRRRRRYLLESSKLPNMTPFNEVGIIAAKDLESDIGVIRCITGESCARRHSPAKFSADNITAFWADGFIELELRPAIFFLS